MNLGMSVLAFLGIGIVVMALFCLITRYFNKKLEKALQDENEVYSMIQQIRGGKDQNQQQEDGEYENYINKKQSDLQKGNKTNEPFQLEMTDIKQSLRGANDDIYGLGKLKRRLEGDSLPINPTTGRSISSLKSFQPERLDSKRSNASNRSKLDDQNTENMSQGDPSAPKKSRKDKKKDNVTLHKYVSKVAAYIEQGILLIENNVLSVSKKDNIQQKRNIKKSTIKPSQSSFNDMLEAYGFEKGIFCVYKFQTTLQIPHMKVNQQYPVNSLKSTENKEQIQFPQFYSLRDKLQDIS